MNQILNRWSYVLSLKICKIYIKLHTLLKVFTIKLLPHLLMLLLILPYHVAMATSLVSIPQVLISLSKMVTSLCIIHNGNHLKAQASWDGIIFLMSFAVYVDEFFYVLLVMFQFYVLLWHQKSTAGCLQPYCVISLPQASIYNKVINIVQA